MARSTAQIQFLELGKRLQKVVSILSALIQAMLTTGEA
jgi:hypothetical protein